MVTLKSEATGSYLFSKINTFKDGSCLRQINVLFGDDVVSFYTQPESELSSQCAKLVTGSFISCELEVRLFNGNWKPKLISVSPAKV